MIHADLDLPRVQVSSFTFFVLPLDIRRFICPDTVDVTLSLYHHHHFHTSPDAHTISLLLRVFFICSDIIFALAASFYFSLSACADISAMSCALSWE